MGSFLRGPNQVNQELTQFFKDNGFEVSWDHDRYYEWIEIYENNNRLADLSIKIKQSGLQVDADYFEQETGIKLDKTINDKPEIKPENPIEDTE